jgi:hypothetical protein
LIRLLPDKTMDYEIYIDCSPGKNRDFMFSFSLLLL